MKSRVLKLLPLLVAATLSVQLVFISFSAALGTGPGPTAAEKAPPEKTPPETVIVFIGDSLTQGYGVRAEEAYPELVGEKLRALGYNVKVINGGISGSVTAEADRRLRWYAKARPKIVVLALGANDGMKGTPTDVIERNLSKAIDLAKSEKIEILLAGLKMFSNLGPTYVRNFESIYPRLAKQKKVALIPFLLEDVALQKEFNQADMRHPNAQGHIVIADRVTKDIESILKKLAVRTNSGEIK